MKIVCDNCTTKYQIADEKVSGKAFKIRCKKCGHVIVVNKGAGEAGAGPAGAPDGAAAPEAAAPPAEAAPPSDAVWHLVIDREQVGPMTADEVRSKVKGGQVDAETYGWKEGFDDWKKLSDIDDFKDSFAGKAPAAAAAPAPDDQATRRTEPADLQRAPVDAGPAPGADLFSGAGAAAEAIAGGGVRTASPQAATMMADQSPVANYGGGADHGYGGGADQGHGGDVGGDAARAMTGARSENSVLFSLNNLSALAGGGGNQPAARGGGGGGAMPSVQSEASGLIDIRAMAAATLGTNQGGNAGLNRAPDLFAGGDVAPVFTAVAPPVLVPSAEPVGVPKWVWALVGVGGFVILSLIGFLIWYVQQPPPGTVVAQGTGPATGAGAGAGTTAGGPSPTVGTTVGTAPAGSGTGSTTAPTENKGSTAAPPTKPATDTPKGDGGKSSSKPSKSEGGSKSSKSEGKSSGKSEGGSAKAGDKEPEIPAAPTPKPVEKPKANKPKDDLDSLLDSASSGSGGKPSGGGGAKKDVPEQLSMDQIKSGLKGASLGACKAAGASGVYNVRLTIGKNGKVSSASASGGAAADCVEKAVKDVKFSEFSGDPMTLSYPVIVR